MADLRDKKLSIEDVNGMDFQQFIETFASVIEHTRLVAATVWSYRPYANLQALHRAFANFIQTDLFPEARAGIIRCHPDLAGKLSQSRQLSKESTREQTAAGLLELTDSERKELTTLNERYKKKFGFPFVVCARENKKEAIFAGLRARLGNEVADEVQEAVREISKIAWYRLNDIVIGDETHQGSDGNDSKL